MGAGDRDPPLLAARQLVGSLVGQSHLGQQPPRVGLDLGRGHALDLDRGDGDVARHAHVLDQVVPLEHYRHAVAPGAQAVTVAVVEPLAVDQRLWAQAVPVRLRSLSSMIHPRAS